MVYGHVLGIFLALSLQAPAITRAQNETAPQSPCPNIFQYQVNARKIWSGVINVPAVTSVDNIKLNVELGLDAVLPSQYSSELQLVENKYEVWKKLATGDKQPIQYRLYFPVSLNLPVVKRIALNQDVICEAFPQPTVTRLLLEHTLYPVRSNQDKESNNKSILKLREEVLEVHYEQYPPPQGSKVNSSQHVETVGVDKLQPTPPQSGSSLGNEDECGIAMIEAVPLIIYGQSTTRGEWPWLVAMFVKSISGGLQFQCGGSLLSKTIVLTAAHCIKYKNRPEVKADSIVLYMGKFNLQDWTERNSQPRDVEKVHLHPEYKSTDRKLDSDLAILILKETVEYTIYVRPICLWSFSNDINRIVGENGTVVGWGKDEKGTIGPEPHQVTMPIVSQAQCVLSNREFYYYVSNRTFCAGMRDGSGPCNGDSGGGFMIGYQEGNILRWYLRGMVHLSLLDHQNQQCDLASYLIYTDVALYMDWVQKFVT